MKGRIISRGNHFLARYFLGRTEDGKKIYHSKSFDTINAAESYLEVCRKSGPNTKEVFRRSKGSYISYVYFLLDSVNGFVKIGRSINPEHRTKIIKDSYPLELELLGVIIEKRFWRDETKIHSDLKDYVHKGEWFVYNLTVQVYIKDLLENHKTEEYTK